MAVTAVQKLERLLFRQLNRAMKDFGLINDGDRVLVGLSGGKDSLCLTQLLAMRSKVKHPDFKVEAMHVRMQNVDYETDTAYLENFCKQLGVALHVVTTRFEPDTRAGRNPCFLCSWTRRKALFEFCSTHGFNKLALGHHNDDILCTTLMNLMFEGSFGTMPALLRYRKMELTLIRPLCRIREADLTEWGAINNYQKQLKHCPYEHESNRTRAKALLGEMEQLNPELRYSMWHALEKENKLVET